MKREIKFRAWQNSELLTMPISSNFGISRFFGFLYDDAVIMQYTGLKDKNGKEIYEGDIADGHSDGLGVIEWSNFDGGYHYKFKDDNVVGIWEVLKDIIIIGNIYQNPDLL